MNSSLYTDINKSKFESNVIDVESALTIDILVERDGAIDKVILLYEV